MRKNQLCAINVQYNSANNVNKRQPASILLHRVQSNSSMSVNVSVVLDTRRALANGLFPVRVRFYFKKQAYYINTGVEVKKENFMFDKITGLSKSAMYNRIIANKLEYVYNTFEDMLLSGALKTFSSGSDVKKFIEGRGDDNTNNSEREPLHFQKYVIKHIQRYSTKASAEQYRMMLRKVESYCGLDDLYIDDITVSWLKDFESFCENSGMNTNGRGYYLRAIRTIWNDAIDRELIGYDKYPFRRFKIKKSETAHRDMNLVDLRVLINFECSGKDAHIALYRDIFMLSFYFCGLNIKDLLLLKHTDMRNGYISILRAKTKVPVLLRVEPEAMEIINRYRGINYLLNVMDRYKNTDDFRRRLNRALKTVFPFISVYWARHTWATVAAELDIADSTIDIAMGHKLQGISSVYVRRNISKVYEANRKVIDYVYSK